MESLKLYPLILMATILLPETCALHRNDSINLQAPCVLYIGQAFRYSPDNAFYIFNQQIYLIT